MNYTVLYVSRSGGLCYEKTVNKSARIALEQNPFFQVLHYTKTKEEVK